MPRYEYSDGTSQKFWSIELIGSDVVCEWGRIGSKGQSKRKRFNNPPEARGEYRKSIAAKEAKGYRFVGDPNNHDGQAENAGAALLSFVNDLTNGDEQMLDCVRSLLAEPQSATDETMGFHPHSDQHDLERVFLKTIHNLDEYGYLRSFEDKYIDSMLSAWTTSDFIPTNELTSETLHFAEKLSMPTSKIGGGPRDLPEQEARELAEQFEEAVADVELAVAKAGQALLSVDISGGDHLYTFSMLNELAEKWRDVVFGSRDNGEPLAVRGFMWEQFAEFLKYANGIELKPMSGKRANQPLQPICRQHTIISPQNSQASEPVRVRHAKFGAGQILRDIDFGDARKYEIQFEDGTCRTILARFTELLD